MIFDMQLAFRRGLGFWPFGWIFDDVLSQAKSLRESRDGLDQSLARTRSLDRGAQQRCSMEGSTPA